MTNMADHDKQIHLPGSPRRKFKQSVGRGVTWREIGTKTMPTPSGNSSCSHSHAIARTASDIPLSFTEIEESCLLGVASFSKKSDVIVHPSWQVHQELSHWPVDLEITTVESS
jgi:hypothetical protein